MRATTSLLADVVNIRAHIKTFATEKTKIDFRERNSLNAVAIHVDEAWLTLNDATLPCQFVKRNACVLFRRDHRGQLIKVAPEFFERCADGGLTDPRHVALIHDFTFSILRACRDSECERTGIFLILAHEQILDFGSTSDRQEKQAGSNRVECSAVAHFSDLEPPADQCDNIMRSHPFGLIDQQDAVRSRA